MEHAQNAPKRVGFSNNPAILVSDSTSLVDEGELHIELCQESSISTLGAFGTNGSTRARETPKQRLHDGTCHKDDVEVFERPAVGVFMNGMRECNYMAVETRLALTIDGASKTPQGSLERSPTFDNRGLRDSLPTHDCPDHEQSFAYTQPEGDQESYTGTSSHSGTAPSQYDSDTSSDSQARHDFRLHVQDIAEPVSQRLIEETDSELINRALYSDHDPVEEKTNAAIAAITGRGLPKITRQSRLQGEPSEITDLGDQMYANLRSQGRTASIPISYDESEDLQDRLFAAICHTHLEKKGFLPKGQLAGLVHEESVTQELTRCLSETHSLQTIQNYARQVCYDSPPQTTEDEQNSPRNKSFRNVFAILVLIEKSATIDRFLNEGVSDADLPLVMVKRLRKHGQYDLCRKDALDQPLECFRKWTQITIRNFEEWQWTMLAPFFTKGERKNVKHYVLQDQAILPFTYDSRRHDSAHQAEELGGGFGRVFRAEIHPDHNDFNDPVGCNRSFAIKRLYSPNKADFSNEVEMLKRFSGDSHPHLISLLATYEQFKSYYLIFHWAEADLLKYWTRVTPKPVVDRETVLWMAQQCEGIADGLLKIHRYESHSLLHPDSAGRGTKRLSAPNLTESGRKHHTSSTSQLYGRHGDIKPQNVLWFRDPKNNNDRGTLKISDFGVAEFNTRNSRSAKPRSQVAISPTYRPPECDLQGGAISRSYDIWTLGCLYLEFITWILGGRELFIEFAERRKTPDLWVDDVLADTFFEIVKCEETGGTPGARVKPEVIEFISGLHSHPSCTDYFHDFLVMIQCDMLIVEPNDSKEKRRINCGEVHQKLGNMYRGCLKFPDYATKPATWSNIDKEYRSVVEAIEADLTEQETEALCKKNLRVHAGPTQKKMGR